MIGSLANMFEKSGSAGKVTYCFYESPVLSMMPDLRFLLE